ncbi:NAD-dependent epimerase/dehydratase family protein [Teredinibacter franksiae]|uniref:NAD-dependent epimerase/dehydratase family protein n=1 Tax=Teredinibacter franksiae TaxID=2761453 RepID=UPI0016277B31|nr:NAD-dependent epimerase/dehydratase family protein [Teredinibacter franksiae]
MKILFIGGTGNISLSVSKRLLEKGEELWLLNRSGACSELPGAKFIQGDIASLGSAEQTLAKHHWDVVVNWVVFTPEEAQRDIELFRGRTAQYSFISSASCYQNPGPTAIITENTPLENRHWDYSRNKMAAEHIFNAAFKSEGFPITVVRPSHTYSRVIPLTIGGWDEYTAVARMKAGKPVVVQGDGHSLWTLTHAEDFAVGFCGLLGNKKAIGEDFHITSDFFLSWNEIYQQTARAAGCEAEIVHVTSDKICALNTEYTGTLLGDKSVSAIFDNTKIKSLVPEFKAKINYAEGIARTLEWFEADPRRQVISPETDAFIDRLILLEGR